MRNYLFSSESVANGHPDKICDRISDSIVDLYLAHHPEARTAIECFATTNRLIIGGEVNSTYHPSNAKIEDIARQAIRDIGYQHDGFDWRSVNIEIITHRQSPDIAAGVDATPEHPEGAGDQGIMFGYASAETNELMPAAIYYAHLVLRDLNEKWKQDPELGLGPDAKCQVTVKYQNDIPIALDNILVSVMHKEEHSNAYVREQVLDSLARVIPKQIRWDKDRLLTNPTGRFVLGGPKGDAGLTGRKIIVDTYGGAAPHGGGAFSGKDPTKVDRSAAYIARYLAKNIVAAKIASRCLIQLAYAIGVAKPLSLYINCFNTTDSDTEQRLLQLIPSLVDLSPHGIRTHLQLNRPIYAVTSSYGHFGRKPRDDGSFSWEKLDLVEQLLAELGSNKVVTRLSQRA